MMMLRSVHHEMQVHVVQAAKVARAKTVETAALKVAAVVVLTGPESSLRRSHVI
jgi:hypothetical protein